MASTMRILAIAAFSSVSRSNCDAILTIVSSGKSAFLQFTQKLGRQIRIFFMNMNKNPEIQF